MYGIPIKARGGKEWNQVHEDHSAETFIGHNPRSGITVVFTGDWHFLVGHRGEYTESASKTTAPFSHLCTAFEVASMMDGSKMDSCFSITVGSCDGPSYMYVLPLVPLLCELPIPK